jgi:hypothetical protein
LTTSLKSPQTIKAAKQWLERLHDLIALQRIPASLNPPTAATGLFLAAYLIANHPNEILSGVPEHEADRLIHAAARLTSASDALQSALAADPPSGSDVQLRDLLLEYAAAMPEYAALFRSWKDQDQERLAGSILHTLNAMAGALGMTADPAQRAPLLAEVAILRSRLRRLRVERELDGFDRQHPDLALESDALVGSGGGFEVAASSVAAAATMSNEQLTHEVLIDPSYQLRISDGGVGLDGVGGGDEGDNDYDLAVNRVQAIRQAAFWARVEEDLRQEPPRRDAALRVLSQVVGCAAAAARGGFWLAGLKFPRAQPETHSQLPYQEARERQAGPFC